MNESNPKNGSKTDNGSVAKPYQRNAKEEASVARYDALHDTRSRAPNYKIKHNEETGQYLGDYEHPDIKTAVYSAMAEMGTGDTRFFDGLFNQVTHVGDSNEPVSERSANFILSVIGAVEPQNEIEAMLAAQMAVVHQATMSMATSLNRADFVEQQEPAERALNKLARTFTMQMDALKRFRAKAQQTVRVERVTVEEGGQAIVGNVDRGGRGDRKK